MFCRTAIALVLSTASFTTYAEVATLAVAANFAEPMKAIAADFERATGHTLKLSIGATGKFYAQIKNGAPFDVLLAADDETPARLIAEQQAVPGSAFTYATGRLVLWSADAGRINANADTLKSGDFSFLAIANPATAPYGRAALETLAALKLDVPTRKRVVGESIAQTYQFAATGNAEIGFVALSQVWKDGKLTRGSAWRVPVTMHQPIRQNAVILKRGQDNAAARALLDWLKTPAAKVVIERYGYGV
jgi:molybdate transport system substrate-binding protein